MQPAIRAENVRKSFRGRAVLKGVGLEVRKGEVFSLLGPNGAGKTTFIDIASGLLEPDKGHVEMDGEASFVSGNDEFYWTLTAGEILDIYSGIYGRRRKIPRFLRVPEHLDWSSMSSGQKMRLRIAVALMKNPDILFMDEPTVGLDPDAARRFREIIKSMKGSVTIFLISHYMRDVEELADRVAFLISGKIRAVGKIEDFSKSTGKVVVEYEKITADVSKFGMLKGKVLTTTIRHLPKALEAGRVRKIHTVEKSIEDYFIEVSS